MTYSYEDPRRRNVAFDSSTVSSFVGNYASAFAATLKSVDSADFAKALQFIQESAANGGTLYLCGNGGSAAICDHLVCDFIKGTYHADHPSISAVSLTENVALYSAVANDYSFDEVFAFQLEMRLRANDVVLAVSSSGNSHNIIRAVETAKAKGVPTIGLSGFSGGRLKGLADASLHLPMDNYGVVEDGHSALLHMMVQLIANQRDGR